MESGNTEATVKDRLVMWLVVSHAVAFLLGAGVLAWLRKI
ncbi:hypothetical protein BCF11_4886 [Collimonas sp. PA-H2]|nr:hypothetical protein BCF11_4886 [Collimonas sp. PA-H2]